MTKKLTPKQTDEKIDKMWKERGELLVNLKTIYKGSTDAINRIIKLSDDIILMQAIRINQLKEKNK